MREGDIHSLQLGHYNIIRRHSFIALFLSKIIHFNHYFLTFNRILFAFYHVYLNTLGHISLLLCRYQIPLHNFTSNHPGPPTPLLHTHRSPHSPPHRPTILPPSTHIRTSSQAHSVQNPSSPSFPHHPQAPPYSCSGSGSYSCMLL